MKLAANGLLLGSFMLSGGNAIGAGDVFNGSALAMLGVVVWHIMTKAFPAHDKSLEKATNAFLGALAEERTALLDAQKEIREGNAKSLRQLSESIDSLSRHCSRR